MEHHPRRKNFSRANSLRNLAPRELVGSPSKIRSWFSGLCRTEPNEYRLPTAVGTVLARSPVSAPRFQTISRLSRLAWAKARLPVESPQWRSRACIHHLARLRLLLSRPASRGRIGRRFLRLQSFAENTACQSKESCTHDLPAPRKSNPLRHVQAQPTQRRIIRGDRGVGHTILAQAPEIKRNDIVSLIHIFLDFGPVCRGHLPAFTEPQEDCSFVSCGFMNVQQRHFKQFAMSQHIAVNRHAS